MTGHLIWMAVAVVATLFVCRIAIAGDAREALLRGILGAGVVLVVAALVLQAWFLYNRAIDGEKAWICLQQPQVGCGIASPPPKK